MKKYLVIFGTRPELIKVAPLIFTLKKNNKEFRVCNTGQHKEMIAPLLNFFEIMPDYNLEVMKHQQSLTSLTASLVTEIQKVIEIERPTHVIVQGDTTTAFVGGLIAFYNKVKVIHIEAGLRTNDIYSPFPEEANRKFLTQIADYHFAPTEPAKKNLNDENVKKNVIVTGNTSIDALRIYKEKVLSTEFGNIIKSKYSDIYNFVSNKKVDFKRMILVTMHRRENHGEPLKEICLALKNIVENFPENYIVLPVHKNPAVQDTVNAILGQNKQIFLLEPLDYPEFIWFMHNSDIILTDSGGVQEEGPYFKKPILVLRENTERPEIITAGLAKLVGHNQNIIEAEVKKLISDANYYSQFQKQVNPFGTGYASDLIMKYIG